MNFFVILLSVLRMACVGSEENLDVDSADYPFLDDVPWEVAQETPEGELRVFIPQESGDCVIKYYTLDGPCSGLQIDSLYVDFEHLDEICAMLSNPGYIPN